MTETCFATRREYGQGGVDRGHVRYSRAALLALLITLCGAAGAQESSEPEPLKDARVSQRFEVSSLARVTEGPPEEAVVCREWTLSSRDVKRFFAHAEMLNPTEWHYSYDILPCAYTGWLSVDGLDYKFGINAGGFGTIELSTSGGKYLLYSCKRGCEKLFPE
jgi:hypothetical protein